VDFEGAESRQRHGIVCGQHCFDRLQDAVQSRCRLLFVFQYGCHFLDKFCLIQSTISSFGVSFLPMLRWHVLSSRTSAQMLGLSQWRQF
jgi:hypothetical protein